VLFAAALARAEPDRFGLGDGHDGDFVVNATDVVINLSALLSTSANAGTTQLTVSNVAPFMPGQLVMLHQTYAVGPVPPLMNGAYDGRAWGVGRFELARVASVLSPGTLVLTAPLERSFPANATQIVTVPEYRNFTFMSASCVVPNDFDGHTGGIIALLATGSITGDGCFGVDGSGYRGGVAQVDSTASTGCTLNDTGSPRFGQSGEGVFGWSATATALSNVNGGGGGACASAGGGGGANGAPGGNGGASSDGDRDVGGRGGVGITYDPYLHLTFGGGGGAGNAALGNGPSGGNGGGIIFIRALNMDDPLLGIYAQGNASVTQTADSTGGGGAGGTVHIRVVQTLSCTSITAGGGIGEGTNIPFGGGGGGAGARVVLQAAAFNCLVDSTPGTCTGSYQTGGFMSRGCEAGTDGLVTVLPGAYDPDAGPVADPWPTDPYDAGTLPDGGVPPVGSIAPRFLSQGGSVAYCGEQYRYSSRHVPDVIGDGPLTFSVAGEVPAGATVNASTGELSWTPTVDEVGSHTFTLSVSGPGGSAAQQLDVSVECNTRPPLKAGCSSVTDLISAIALIVLLRRRR
jgi:hypothetical protein